MQTTKPCCFRRLSCFFCVSLINQRANLEVSLPRKQASGWKPRAWAWSLKKSEYYHFYGNLSLSVLGVNVFLSSATGRALKQKKPIRFNSFAAARWLLMRLSHTLNWNAWNRQDILNNYGDANTHTASSLDHAVGSWYEINFNIPAE